MGENISEQNKIEISGSENLTATSVGILSLLPLVFATSIGAPVGNFEISGNLADTNSFASGVNIKYEPSSQISISEGIEIPTNSIESLFQTLSKGPNAGYSHNEEFGILENFIGSILENAEQQPAELKSLMYENIDELLI